MAKNDCLSRPSRAAGVPLTWWNLRVGVASGVPGVIEEDYSFESGGCLLQGTLALPESGASPSVGLISLHGWGGSRSGPHRFFVTLGREFAARGGVALRFDFSGRGVSDGDEAIATLDGMIADTLAAIDGLKEQLGLSQFILVGLCSGGNVAIGAGVLRSDLIAHLFCLSTFPFSSPGLGRARSKAFGVFCSYLNKACSPHTWYRLLRGEVNVRAVGGVMEDALQESGDLRALKDSCRDIMTEFASFPASVHFLYGGGDPEAPEALRFFKDFTTNHGLSVSFHTVPGANHNFYAAQWALALREIIFFRIDAG